MTGKCWAKYAPTVTAPAAETPLTNASRDRDGGLRALPDKKSLMVIIDEDVIKASKIAAIEVGRNVSGITQELLEARLAGRKSRK